MKRAVIGIGSPHEVDQLGWLVVEYLQRGADLPDVDYLLLDRPGPALLQQMEGYREVVLVDAMLDDDTESPSGKGRSVRVLSPSELLQGTSKSLSTHGMGLQQTIALGAALQQLPDKMSVIGVRIPEKPEQSEQAIEQAVIEVKRVLSSSWSE